MSPNTFDSQNNEAMKKILVPCDFSEPSINAFRFALDVASISRGTVHLLNVIELPAMPNSVFTPVVELGMPLRREMSAKAQKNFENILTKYQSEDVKEVISKVEFGVPTKVILSYAKKHSIDTIIMGSHGATGFREVFVGSQTEKIVRTSPVPVIVVKGFYKGPVKNIVFPCTLESEDQAALIIKVKALQAFFKSTLHLVWINTPANFTQDTVTTKRLNAFAKSYGLKDFTISVFNHVYEEEGILQFANAIDADMIAMGTHGRKGLSRMMYGSKTENVANHGKGLLWTYVMK